jgi:hypothetical protein
VAAVSWADTQTPETTLGNHSPKKAGFLSANQTEVFSFGALATCNPQHERSPAGFNELECRTEPILIVLVLVLDFNAIDRHRSAAGRSSFLNQL